MIRILALFLFTLQQVFACSIYSAGTGKSLVIAKNFDWTSGYGELIIRPRQAQKHSLNNEITWLSKYGSLTFSQFGPDLPIGGINEKGLTIEALVLPKTIIPFSNEPTLNEGEWIQYQLDNYKSTEQVISNIEKYPIETSYVRAHYFVCDATSNCAVVEFISNEIKVYTDEKLVEKILTNSTYADSIGSLTSKDYDFAKTAASLTRFNIIQKSDKTNTKWTSVLENLNKVKIGGYTKWQFAYYPNEKKLSLNHNYSNKTLRVDLKNIDYECQENIKAISLEKSETIFSDLDVNLEKRLSKKIISKAYKNELLGRELKNNCLMKNLEALFKTY